MGAFWYRKTQTGVLTDSGCDSNGSSSNHNSWNCLGVSEQVPLKL